jgi:signal transduction histidine kinase
VTARSILVPAVLFILAVAVTVVLLNVTMGAPRSDMEDLAFTLTVSGAGSLLLGATIVRWGGFRLGSLRLRLMLAYLIGLLVVLANVVVASAQMFLSTHDLTLLLLVLGFAAAISGAFGYTMATALTSEIDRLATAARRLAQGDLDVRVHSTGVDEVARLAQSFDHMASELQAAFERERRFEAGRRELIAAVSHDLRTPLSTTQAMVEALMDGVVSEPAEVQRYYDLIRGEVQHLGRLIDDLFELSQLESGAIQLELAPTEVGELIAQTMDAYHAQARERGVTVESRVDPSLPAVTADAARLQRVLRNLVDNGLRYTPPGGRVLVEASRDGNSVAVSVADSGPGILADDLERIFDRFYRGERARSRTEGRPDYVGAGLGLAIARALVTAHGGQIWAERPPEGGAQFRFTIPARMV